MLGKLFKHEWKTVWKIPTLLVVISLLSALFCGLSMALPAWGRNLEGIDVITIFIVLIFYTVAIIASSAISIYLGVRFYKSMFTDEGYLTHTLPASSNQILFSKAAVMSIWSFISVITILISVFIFIATIFTCASAESDVSLQTLFIELKEASQRGEFAGWQGFLVLTGLFSIISCISGTMTLIGAISIGQMFRKHRVIGAIGAYFAICTVMQTISTICTLPWFVKSMNNTENISSAIGFDNSVFQIYTSLFCITGVIAILVSIAMYVISNTLLKKQLELE